MELDLSEISLTPPEIRVLGCLMEKATTTPEYYPMSLNGLTNACNQKTSRDPVTEYDEDEVLDVLDELRNKHLVMRVDFAGSRVAKFKHLADKLWELHPSERAILTILFLRGAQTAGQIRQRTERLYAFPDLKSVEECLLKMTQRDLPPHSLIKPLGKLPGAKDIRFTHFLASDEEIDSAKQFEPTSQNHYAERSVLSEKIVSLEEKITSLEGELKELNERFSQFENQFK